MTRLCSAASSQWPAGYAAGHQCPPYKYGLKQKARPVVSPARRRSVDGDIVYRVIDVCWKNANCIKGQAHSRCISYCRYQFWRHEQTQSSRELGDPGPKDHVFREGNPFGRDGKKACRAFDVQYSRCNVKKGQQRAEKDQAIAICSGGACHGCRPIRAMTVTKNAVDQPNSRKLFNPSSAAIICLFPIKPTLE